MAKWITVILTLLSLTLRGQGLFESAVTTGSNAQGSVLMNGFARGVFYLGQNSPPLPSQVRSSYSEIALKLRSGSRDRARFYSEIRFRGGSEYNSAIVEMDLLEAYAEIDIDRLNLRVGQQVISWGRADGFNPTHNLSPQNYFVRSPDPDDLNMGNIAVRSRFSLMNNLRLEAVWVPVYRHSIYRFDLFDIPDYVELGQRSLPRAMIHEGSLAARIEFLFSRFDGSVSWFSGYDPMPGIEAGRIPVSPREELTIELYQRAFRQQTLGLDFSCGMGSFGVRGEAAFRIPSDDFKDEEFTPGQDLRYVLGVDRTLGDLSIMVMYLGQFVFDHPGSIEPGGIPEIDPLLLQDPMIWNMLGTMMDEKLRVFNRVVFGQTEEFSHTLAFRPSLTLLHGMMDAGIFSLYNLSTEEWQVYPKIGWKVTDDLNFTVGGQYFGGPENSMYDLISPVFNGGFIELKYTF